MIVDEESSLADFRNHNTGRVVIDHLALHPKMLVALPVGVGKSYNMDDVIEEAVRGGHYQAVIALVATRAIINERRWIKSPPDDVKIANLLPRPKNLCGSLNVQWEDFETRGLSQYARQHLCSKCLNQVECSWLSQYGSNLAGTKVIFATQTHYENNPQFIDLLISWSGADKTLVVIDEAGFLMNLPRVTIRRGDLEKFGAVLNGLREKHDSKLLKKWADFVDVLMMTTTTGLQTPNAWHLYDLESFYANLIQAAGVQAYPDDFCYLGGVLVQLGKSHPYSRECLSGGDISFAQMLNISTDFIVYSGTTELELLQYRLEQECFDLYKGFEFRHKQTRWFNIATTLAADRHFKRNLPQILDFFADLIIKRVLEGKRVLLVAKKRFKALCEVELNNRFRANNSDILAKVEFGTADLTNNRIVPIIHYGVIGINLFEDFDCCFCLTSYFVDQKVVDQTIQSIYSSDLQIPLEIAMVSSGIRRRIMKPKFAKDRFFDVSTLAHHALNYNEMGVVIQAVGRVRPFTKPREIITLQCSELLHAGGGYTQEFTSFEGARKFFKIQSKRQSDTQNLQTRISDLKCEGFTQKEVSNRLNISVRTVKRHWNTNNSF